MEGVGGDVVEECQPGTCAQPALGPLLHLDEDGSGDDEAFGGALERAAECGVVGVAAVERGVIDSGSSLFEGDLWTVVSNDATRVCDPCDVTVFTGSSIEQLSGPSHSDRPWLPATAGLRVPAIVDERTLFRADARRDRRAFCRLACAVT